MFTIEEMPTVTRANRSVNSYVLLTGVLYLIIDNAPIIPSDKSKFDDIDFVIIAVIIGNINDNAKLFLVFR